MVRYSHLSKSFLQFVMIHTVKGFNIVNETEIDVLLKSSCFVYNPANVGSLTSSPYSFSKPSLDIWKFLVQHIMLKLSLQNLKHDLTSMGDEYDCLMISTFFGTTLLGNWDVELYNSWMKWAMPISSSNCFFFLNSQLVYFYRIATTHVKQKLIKNTKGKRQIHHHSSEIFTHQF